MKNQILALAICLLLGNSLNLFSQEVVPTVAKSLPTTAVAKPASEAEVIEKRVEAQVNRLMEQYKLDEAQVEEVKKLYLESEQRQKELREELANIVQERNDKFNSLLTEEQKEIKPAVLTPRARREMLKQNKEGTTSTDKVVAPAVPAKAVNPVVPAK